MKTIKECWEELRLYLKENSNISPNDSLSDLQDKMIFLTVLKKMESLQNDIDPNEYKIDLHKAYRFKRDDTPTYKVGQMFDIDDIRNISVIQANSRDLAIFVYADLHDCDPNDCVILEEKII